MLPKEHGAYGQMAFPLVTALAIGEVTASALLLVVSVVGLFVAHEPLLVLLGARGQRARREQGRRAAVWLAVAAVMAVGTAVAAFLSIAPELRWAFAVPVLPATVLGAAVAARQDKSSYGETAAALAFSLAAFPVALAAGASSRAAAAVAIVFALTFVTQTFAVRGVVLAVRGGGNPGAVRASRRTALALAIGGGIAVLSAATRNLLPWAALAAVVPGVIATVALIVSPPPPTRLRTVGWTLVSVSTVTLAILAIWL